MLINGSLRLHRFHPEYFAETTNPALIFAICITTYFLCPPNSQREICSTVFEGFESQRPWKLLRDHWKYVEHKLKLKIPGGISVVGLARVSDKNSGTRNEPRGPKSEQVQDLW